MKDLWVLSIRTSLPETCNRHSDLKSSFAVFDSFEKACSALHKELHKLAFSHNAMFDGEGRLVNLKKYWLYDEDEDDECENDVLNKQVLDQLQEILLAVFNGTTANSSLAPGNYTDWMIEVELTEDAVRVFGVDDGPCNGYDPVVATNMLSMQEENDYYLYINDALGQDDYSSELYIDLKKVVLNG